MALTKEANTSESNGGNEPCSHTPAAAEAAAPFGAGSWGEAGEQGVK